jgi:hypothetical protein
MLWQFPSHRVCIEMRGIPVHAWTLSIAQGLLRGFCTSVELHSDSKGRRDLSCFKVLASCRRPELIPVLIELLIPELEKSSLSGLVGEAHAGL